MGILEMLGMLRILRISDMLKILGSCRSSWDSKNLRTPWDIEHVGDIKNLTDVRDLRDFADLMDHGNYGNLRELTELLILNSPETLKKNCC